MQKHIYTYINPIRERDIDLACEILRDDGVIAYATDTNWAFACLAESSKALQKVRLLKPSHPKDQPFSIVVDSVSMAAHLGTISQSDYRILKKVLPGPYTVILLGNRSLYKQIYDKRKTVGVRFPARSIIIPIIEALKSPLASTSVPMIKDSYQDDMYVPAQFGYQIAEVFGHGLDLIMDLGDEVSGEESTIIDLTLSPPAIIRQGAGDKELLKSVGLELFMPNKEG